MSVMFIFVPCISFIVDCCVFFRMFRLIHRGEGGEGVVFCFKY